MNKSMEIGPIFHFPFSIFHLSFSICHLLLKRNQAMTNLKLSKMTNDKWKMENGK
jgi:hypothetical protein